VAKFTLDLKNAKNHREVVLLTSAAIRHFGGLDRFVRVWLHHVDAARREKPGGKKVLDFFHAMMRLQEYCEATRSTRLAPSQMSDEELNQRAIQLAKGLVQTEPELAIAAAHQLGWTVIPPDSEVS
jgi:hypothetical protein